MPILYITLMWSTRYECEYFSDAIDDDNIVIRVRPGVAFYLCQFFPFPVSHYEFHIRASKHRVRVHVD